MAAQLAESFRLLLAHFGNPECLFGIDESWSFSGPAWWEHGFTGVRRLKEEVLIMHAWYHGSVRHHRVVVHVRVVASLRTAHHVVHLWRAHIGLRLRVQVPVVHLLLVKLFVTVV